MEIFNLEKFKNGLSEAERNENINKYGLNEMSRKKRKTFFQIYLESFKDIWIIILLVALLFKIALVVLSFFFPFFRASADGIEICSILASILLATGFSSFSEYKNTSRSEALQEEYSKTFAKVIVSGNIDNKLTKEITKYDTILLQAGDKVPVDGLLISGFVKVSQAALNGESREEEKSAASDFSHSLSTDYSSKHKIFTGSVVTSGEGLMIATVIGDETEIGKINLSLSEENERQDTSSLKLKKVASTIAKIGVSAAAIVALMHLFISFSALSFDFSGYIAEVFYILANTLMLMASVVIMAVPEGLPMMNSLVQSMNTESMYKKNILVTHKAAFSDSAYMDVLFTDKTGTVTQGVLTLCGFINARGEFTKDITDDIIKKSIVLNNLAKVSSTFKAIGSNNMDRALLNYAIEHDFVKDYGRDEIVEISGFDSEKKCSTAKLKDGSTLYKGASDYILDSITHYEMNGEVFEFGNEDRERLLQEMKTQMNRSMKLLSVVIMRDGKTILISVLCVRDDVRSDVVETMDILRSAGIQVIMVTGDGKHTAVSIARDANIVCDDENDLILSHDELEKMSDDELKANFSRLRVVSRAKPLDKKRLVLIAQEAGHVCAMTGDGVNDAPALKAADVGFAMGDGTAVAQEAGDVVILSNSLTSIKDCILNSRTMARSVSNFLIFQLTVNITTLLINIICPILGILEPFTIVQVLWINLIMDTLAAIAFGSEPPLERYMKKKPKKREESIITPYMKSAIATSACFISFVSISILSNLFHTRELLFPTYNSNALFLCVRTLMFTFFIYAVIFNSFNTRSENVTIFEGISRNKRFIFVMLFIAIMQTFIIQYGGVWFGTQRLEIKALLFALLLSLFILPVDVIRKCIVKKCNISN